MKPSRFAYLRPTTVDEVTSCLASNDGAKVVAGGQSLIAMMNFRLAAPPVLVDIARVEGLDEIRVLDGHLRIGAAVTQRTAELDDLVATNCGLIPKALKHVGHVQIRNRGTVCGSVAHADPASELPAVAVAVDAQIRVAGRGGARTIQAGQFFEAPYWTVLADDEFVTAIDFPVDPPGTKSSVSEYARRSGDFALAGVAMRVTPGGELARQAAVAAFGVSGTPLRLVETERALGAGCTRSELQHAIRNDVPNPTEDLQGSGEYRRHLLVAMIERAAHQCEIEIQG